MILRNLGRTGLKVGEIGLGTEHLGRKSKARASIVEVVDKAVDIGVNYFDLIFNFREYLDNYGVALKDDRDKLILACHLGSAERNGQYLKTRDIGIIEKVFTDTLSGLDTDYVDIANITYVKDMKEYEEVTRPGSVLDFAERLKKEEKIHHIGISTHDTSVVQTAARSGKFEVITYQVNMANNALPGRNDALAACAREGVGLVAMKPFAGGCLLWRNKTIFITRLRRGGGKTITLKIPAAMTPVRCLAYTLSQAGICTTIPGVSNLEELEEVLSYQNATAEEKDYSEIIKSFKEYHTGQCVYCNHCLPCPSSIDIGRVTRLLDITKAGVTEDAKDKYDALEVKPSECTRCDLCRSRCPFDVDVISNMQNAASLFR